MKQRKRNDDEQMKSVEQMSYEQIKSTKQMEWESKGSCKEQNDEADSTGELCCTIIQMSYRREKVFISIYGASSS